MLFKMMNHLIYIQFCDGVLLGVEFRFGSVSQARVHKPSASNTFRRQSAS